MCWVEIGLGALVEKANHLRMQCQSKDVMLHKERISRWLKQKGLVEGVWWVIVRLELSQHGDQYAAIKGGLSVQRGYHMLNLLKGETLKFLQNLCSTHQLSALKCHQRFIFLQ